MPIHFLNSTDSKRQIEIHSGLNVLGHAQLEELATGSRCGGHGQCGRDLVVIVSGAEALSPVTSVERSFLSQDALDRGVRLACQAWVDDETATIEIKITTPD